MARIQNPNLPWTQLRMRDGRMVQTDGDGVLDGISEQEAAFLGATPGWKVAGPIGEVRTEAPAPVARKPAPKPPEPPPAEPEPVAAAKPVEPEKEPEEEPEEGPDIDGLRTKAEALKIAADYGVALTEDMKLSEMKAQLNAALYPGDDEE